jgi:hypothetical protein
MHRNPSPAARSTSTIAAGMSATASAALTAKRCLCTDWLNTSADQSLNAREIARSMRGSGELSKNSGPKITSPWTPSRSWSRIRNSGSQPPARLRSRSSSSILAIIRSMRFRILATAASSASSSLNRINAIFSRNSSGTRFAISSPGTST